MMNLTDLLAIVIFVASMAYLLSNPVKAEASAFVRDHRVELYSCGELTKVWISSGSVVADRDSNSHSFLDRETGCRIIVSGNLMISPIKDDLQ